MGRIATVCLVLGSIGCSFQGASQSGPEDEVDAGDPPSDGGDDLDASVSDCVPLPAGALAWWDGEQLGVDIVGNHDSDRQNSSPTVTPGFIGNAMTFGNDDDIIFDNPPQGTQFTIEGWIFRTVDDNNDWMTIYGSNQSSGFFLYDNKINFWDATGGDFEEGNALVADTVVPIDTWHHVAITCDGTDLRAYLDGASNGVAEDQEDINLPVGEGRIGGVTVNDGQDFFGQIDELTVYDRALEASEIAAIAAAGDDGKCKPDGDG